LFLSFSSFRRLSSSSRLHFHQPATSSFPIYRPTRTEESMIENLIAQIRKAIPSRSVIIALLGAFALGVLVSTGSVSCRPVPDRPAPLAPLSSPGLVRLGKTYTANLGKVYASAWETGAASLEAGKPVSSALDTVREAWDRDRVQLFNRFVAIEFDKV